MCSGSPVERRHSARSFALIGHADRREVFGAQIRAGERFRDHRLRRAQNFVGVVLDPAGAGKDLLVFALRVGDRLALAIEDDEARARRALIHRSDILHAPVLPIRALV